MIVKKLKRTVFNKPKAAMISGLVDYILAPSDAFDREKRVYAGNRNFITTTAAAQKLEMISLAGESVHSRMPVTHWVLSWSDNETPTTAQVDEAVAMFLRGMELEEHQAIYAVHGNTDNVHVHILVNRVHPCTEKVVRPHRGFDIRAAHRILAEIEHKQGWRSEKRALFTVNADGKVIRNTPPKQVQPPPKVVDREHVTGEKSAIRIAQEKGRDIILHARSWRELHEGLAGVGLQLRRKGSGAVVLVGDVAVKASSVSRHFSLAKLERRLGAFEASPFAPPEHREPEPLSGTICARQWRLYHAEMADAALQNCHDREARRRHMEQLAVTQRAERRTASARLAGCERPLQTIARHFLRQKQKEERSAARRILRSSTHARTISFKEWLRQNYRNYPASDLWRFRAHIPPFSPVPTPRFAQAEVDDAFNVFMEIARRRQKDTPADASRLAGVAAFYMRCCGFGKEAAADALNRFFAGQGGESGRLPRDSERHVNAAYGAHGDITFSRMENYPTFAARLRHLAAQISVRNKAEAQLEAEERTVAAAPPAPPPPAPVSPPPQLGLFGKASHVLLGWLGMGSGSTGTEAAQEPQRQEMPPPSPPVPPKPKPLLPDVDWPLMNTGKWDDFEWRKPAPKGNPRPAPEQAPPVQKQYGAGTETDSPAKPIRQPPREAEPAPSAGETKPHAAPASQPRMRMR